jgi:hypothetical protein
VQLLFCGLPVVFKLQAIKIFFSLQQISYEWEESIANSNRKYGL